MNIKDFFEIAPKSEQTIRKHFYQWKGFKFVNDLGYASEYRVIDPQEKELGLIKYYKGRLLSCYELVPA